jgi:hypothetical protein
VDPGPETGDDQATIEFGFPLGGRQMLLAD